MYLLANFMRTTWPQSLACCPNTQLEEAAYTPKIALNLVTAQKMGMDLPLVLLISADELFDATLAGVDKTRASQ